MNYSYFLSAIILASLLFNGNFKCQKQNTMLANCPDFQIQDYKANPYLKVAIDLQKMGKEQAIQTLISLAEDRANDNKIFVLCRILFNKENNSEFRRPLIGDAIFVGDTSYKDWPLEPIALIDGIPFLIVKGYNVEGKTESGLNYLKYCIKNLAWEEKLYRLKSNLEYQIGLNDLLESSILRNKISEDDKKWFLSQIMD